MKEKLATLLISTKWHALVVSTVLFVRGTLSENGWIMIMLTVIGMKEAHKILAKRGARK